MYIDDWEHIFRQRPCAEGQTWLNTQPDMVTAWTNCVRGDWMWWLLSNVPTYNLTKETAYSIVKFLNESRKVPSFRLNEALRQIKYTGDLNQIQYWVSIALRVSYYDGEDTNMLKVHSDLLRKLIDIAEIKKIDEQI